MDLVKTMVTVIGKIIAKLKDGASAGGAASGTPSAVSNELERAEALVRSAFERDLLDLRAYTLLVSPIVAAGVETGARVYQAGQLARLTGLKPEAAALDATISEARAELPTRQAGWDSTREALRQVPELIEMLKQIPGWDGVASGRYATTNTRQSGASQELAGVATEIPGAIQKVLAGNKLAETQVRMRLQRVAVGISQAQGAPWSLPRTRAAASGLGVANLSVAEARSGRLTEGLTSQIDDQASSLYDQLHAWPTA